MRTNAPLSRLNQTLQTLREGIRDRRWAGVLSGVRPLAKELGVSPATLQTALNRLEAEGLLSAKGPGRPREVSPGAADPISPRMLRVGIVTDEPLSAEGTLNQALLHGIARELEDSGHRPFFAPKSMQALRRDPESIRLMMTAGAADAWVVLNGERALLESLAADFPAPVFALGGSLDGLDIAATRVTFHKAMRECMRRLLALGHGRIVLASPPWWRGPRPPPAALAFSEELAAAGIKTGRYHAPEWEYTGEGFSALLRLLFTLTPPTALILTDMRQVSATYEFLAMRRIPPSHLALVLLDADPSLDWTSPALVRLHYDNEAMIRRVTAWVATLATGGRDTAQVFFEAQLVGDEFSPPPRV
jgi:DNA-binding LacI/PurR family transcriptional regulator